MQKPGTSDIPFVQATKNGLSRRQCRSSFLLLQFDQDPQTSIGKSEFQEEVRILDRPDASFDPNSTR
jgi:hypothetical protein